MRRVGYLLLSATLISGCAGVATNESVSVLLEKSAASSPKLTAYQKGKQYLQLKQYGLAVAAFQQDLQENPDSVRALNGLAIAYDQLGRQDVSQKLLDRALNVDPNSAVTLSNLAYLNLTQGNTAVALAYSERAKTALGAATDMPLPRAIAEAVARNDMIAKDVAANDADAMLPEIINNLPSEDSNVKRVGLNEWELHLPDATPEAGSETVHKTVQARPEVIKPILTSPVVEHAPPVVQDAQRGSRSDAERNLASEARPSPADPAPDAASVPLGLQGPPATPIDPVATAHAYRPANTGPLAAPSIDTLPMARAEIADRNLPTAPAVSPTSVPGAIPPARAGGPSPVSPVTIPVEVPSGIPMPAQADLSPVAMPAPEVAVLGNPAKEAQEPHILAPAARSAEPALPPPALSLRARVAPAPAAVPTQTLVTPDHVQLASALPLGKPTLGEDRNQPTRTEEQAATAVPEGATTQPSGATGQWSLQLPSGTRVRVSNGAGRHLMATRFSHYLGEHGLSVRRIANAASFSYKASIIFYNPEQKDFACELASKLPFDVKLMEAKQGKGWIELVLGSDLLPFDTSLRSLR